MLSKLARLFRQDDVAMRANALYIALVEQSRKAFFYEKLHVPDTPAGRHELILVHLFLLSSRFKQEPGFQETEYWIRALLEAHLSHMDTALREMGVGDVSIGKRMRPVTGALYGRLNAYSEAASSDSGLTETLLRNAYNSDPVHEQDAMKLADYVRQNQAQLAGQPLQTICEGQPHFTDSN